MEEGRDLVDGASASGVAAHDRAIDDRAVGGAAGVALFVRAPIEGYIDAASRAALSDAAETAFKRIARDLSGYVAAVELQHDFVPGDNAQVIWVGLPFLD